VALEAGKTVSFQMPEKILNAPNQYLNGGTHTTGSGFNFRAEPFAQRLSNNPDTSKLFSSAVHGDPDTPLLRAYTGDTMVFRLLHQLMNESHVWTIAGHTFLTERYAADANRKNSIHVGIAERYDLAVVAEGGVFAGQARKPFPQGVSADYRQTAWVGQVTLLPADPLDAGTAYERFTPHGPAALLPLPPADDGAARAALVWCVDAADDPVRELNDAQRLAVLNSVFHPRVGRLSAITPLKDFALGLNAERTLVEGRTVRIGNAAQTLHPVAGQGLNLGLRDAHALVAALQAAHGPTGLDAALRKVEWQRAPDRWALIATTDFLARSFTWPLPGLASARGLGLAALQTLGPLRRAVAKQMMFGWR